MINKNHYGKVGVLMGGTTAERLISLKSGSLVLEALRHQGVDAIGIDVGDDIITQLREQPIDRAFVALHGGIGEDGRLAAILEHMRVPFTGSGTVASALGMDKLRCKWLWQGKGLPTPPCIQLRGEQDFEQVESVLGFPVAIKPVMEGSS